MDMEKMPSFENKRPELSKIAYELGFDPGTRITSILEGMDPAKDFEENKKFFLVDFYIAAEKEIHKIEKEDSVAYSKAQIGLCVYMAQVCKELNNTEMYKEYLNDAIDYAHEFRLGEIVGKLEEISN